MRYTLASLTALAASVSAQGNLTQSLLSSLEDRDDVGVFKGLLGSMPNLIDNIFADAANATSGLKGDGVTLLIPNDEAVGTFLAENPDAAGGDLEAALRPVLSYHVMAAPLRSANFSEPRGLTVPTLLDGKDEQGTSFNLRDAAPEIQQQFGQGATGQVLFAKLEGLDAVRLRTRQGGDQTALRGGLAQSAMMNVVDGEWAGGVYQIVDAVLEPPRPCSNTIRSLRDSLSSLDAALNKTDLWSALNNHANVTCLAPTSDAFKAAGNPEVELNQEALSTALLDHTLQGPSYSNYLRDGMKFATLSNKTVQVTLNDSGIWFNDAKVVQMNVLTNNGLVHVLDKVMTVAEDSDSEDGDGDSDGGSDDPSETDSADGAKETGDGENAAGVFGVNGAFMGAAAALVYVLV